MQHKTVVLLEDGISPEIIELVRSKIPEGWIIKNNPTDAEVIVTSNQDITRDVLRAAGSELGLIIKLVPGSAAIADTEVKVVEVGEPALFGVAEHVVALILALSRQLLYVTKRTKAQEWEPGKETPILTEQRKYTFNWIGLDDFGMIYGKTVGLVGFGYIGKEVAKRLLPFGVRILYYDIIRADPATEEQYGAEYRDLDSLLKESDFVSLHLKFTGDNDKQFSHGEFGLMKPTAFFINTSRGRMVDEEALAEALAAKKIGGAGLDVFYYEPFQPDSPLLKVAGDNVILTPHVAGTPNAQAKTVVANDVIRLIRKYQS